MISSALYRFFGMVQISSCGFLPLSIWTSYFRLGHLPEAPLFSPYPQHLNVWIQHRGLVNRQGSVGEKRQDLDRGYCDCTAAKAAYFQPLGGLCVLARVPSSSRPLANQLPNISDTETDADMDAETDMDTEMETGYENGDAQLRPP
jgi:hypothetical protein